jgi:hypothetical protein
LNIADVTQVVFALIRHTLEAQVSCLYASPDLMVGKELFNESQSHIILYPFYTQHCVGETWRGWGPSLVSSHPYVGRVAPRYLAFRPTSYPCKTSRMYVRCLKNCSQRRLSGPRLECIGRCKLKRYFQRWLNWM